MNDQCIYKWWFSSSWSWHFSGINIVWRIFLILFYHKTFMDLLVEQSFYKLQWSLEKYMQLSYAKRVTKKCRTVSTKLNKLIMYLSFAFLTVYYRTYCKELYKVRYIIIYSTSLIGYIVVRIYSMLHINGGR